MRSASILPELSLDSRFSCVRKRTIGDIFGQVSKIRGLSEKISKLEDYVHTLRDEMTKIEGLKRELPLCMLLLTDAIVAMEEELVKCRKSNAGPVLEEFMPLKRSCKEEKADDTSQKDIISSREKRSWMSSVQLWNSDTITDSNNKKIKEKEMISPATTFPVAGKEKRDIRLPVPSLSLCTPQIKNLREGIINPIVGFSLKSCSSSRSGGSSSGTNNNVQSSARKQRRCWSPELHRRFTNALQQLGGAQAATPKQIRELMKIDGLTNDEVKSHLQKYRLHKQRLSANPSSQSVGLWLSEEQKCNELSLKQRDSQSGSPEGPLHLDGSPESNYGSNDDEDD